MKRSWSFVFPASFVLQCIVFDKMTQMKIAIVELGGSHDECLYAQIKMIKSVQGIHLTLICNDSLKDNVKYYDLVDQKLFIPLKRGDKQWPSLYRLWLQLKKERFNKIIFNTAQGKVIRKLLRFPFHKRTQFYGTLHDTRKIASSHTQKGISKKVRHYFILNEYLEKNMTKGGKNRISFSVYHPIFFPAYPQQNINKKKDEIWICIPGQVELKRRDYTTLFESIKQHGIHKNVKFLLLGRYGHAHGDGDYILKKIAALSVQDHFLLWEKFVPVDVFHNMIKNSDYILPLIHEGDISGNLYKNQISGAYNLAVGYRKALVVEKRIAEKVLMDYEPITYDKETLMKTINELPSPTSKQLYEHEKWSFDAQRKNYLQAIGLDS